jgi:prolyl oligopeptidase
MKIHNYERYDAPSRHGDVWYYQYNEGLKAQDVMYSTELDKIENPESGKVFFDPNELSKDGSVSV